jgi:hypothetical protein
MALIAIGVTGPGAVAQSAHTPAADQLSVAFGIFDVLPREDPRLAIELTYRVVEPWLWKIAPQAGVLLTSLGSVYGYGGFYLPVTLQPWLEIRPLLGVGAYAASAGLDLGHVIEFRSGATLAVRLPGDSDLSISFYHLSNSRLSHRNPGTEVLGVGFSTPWR